MHQWLVVLRVSVALIFLAHSIVRLLIRGSVEQFALYLNNKGLMFGEPIVWAITIFEIAGGIALALGYFRRWLSAGFILLLLVGIQLIHWERGWFVGEHGAGGCEYSFLLIIALLVVAATENKASGILNKS